MNGDDPNDIFYKGMWLNIYPPGMFYDVLALFQQYTRVHGYPNTVIDVGAHQGSVGLVAAHHGAERVVMVEPVHIGPLKRNIKSSGHGDVVELHEGVVADLPEGVAMVEHFDNGGMQSILYDPEYTGFLHQVNVPPKRVPCFSLADIIWSFERVDYLKVDIEGAEFNVFGAGTDAEAALEIVDYVYMEFHPINDPHFLKDDRILSEYREESDGGVKKMLEFAEKCGFKTYPLEYGTNDHGQVDARHWAWDRKAKCATGS